MEFFIAFLEGIITFISPCLLPMLPIYLSYFAGNQSQEDSRAATARTLRNALGFVLGFTLVFVLMGALAGTLGGLLRRHQTLVNIITGAIVVFFGLNFIGLLKINLFKGRANSMAGRELGFFSAVLFGMVFSIGWTPCVGAFLGSALMLASQQGQASTGILMLLCYSAGLGIPFVASALLLDNLKSTFNFIKRHYSLINRICGILLVLIGILMMSGLMSRFLTLLS
ncbi:MAG: cytochrome c biogenesis protein CcdA [Spirochaetaceae bacterium]|nr:cytochrome c biogenesis protein CcdA [Spirochaetaceae bacterium]MBQ8560685.1 cytochrome c biogenesis protein CcdA [Spirochaetaceae bacterium]